MAIDSVSIQIKKGEIYALIGENGAGKSSIFRSIIGDINPTDAKKELYFMGKKLSSEKDLNDFEYKNKVVPEFYKEIKLI